MDSSEITRLSGNLSLVEKNIQIFSQIISETSIPGTESAQDAKLLTQLDKSCREMQTRLTNLLSELDPGAAGDLFMDALRINDDLNNIFVRYERFCRSRVGIEFYENWTKMVCIYFFDRVLFFCHVLFFSICNI